MKLQTTPALGATSPAAPARAAALWAAWARHEWVACLALAALWLGATAWLRPLAIPDEGRYVGVAWEMLSSGQWAVPTLDGLPFFHKPPLFYWITAASMQLFGANVVAARAAPWLGALVTITALYAFVRRWVGAPQARATALVLGTLPLFYAGAQYANLDMLVAGAIAAAVLGFAHATLAREAGAPYQRALALAFAAAACGVLAKGLIGVVLPVLVLLAWGVASRRSSRVAALLLWAPGWLLFAAIAAPWFVAMQQRYPGFAHYFFVVQHLQRYTASGFNNPQPWWFYAAVLLLLALPWSLWLVRWLVQWLRPRGAIAAARGAQADVRALMLAWLAVVTLFFSLPSSKLVGYILPAVAPMAYLIAEAAHASAGRWRRRSVALAAACCVAAAVTAHLVQPKSQQALALRLADGRRPAEAVVYLGRYAYDVGFYAHLDKRVLVVDGWAPDDVAQDSWRRELVDAQRFAGSDVPNPLLRFDELDAALCRASGAWIVGPWPAPAAPRWLAAQPVVYRSGETALWHLDTGRPEARSALGCDAPAGLAVPIMLAANHARGAASARH